MHRCMSLLCFAMLYSFTVYADKPIQVDNEPTDVVASAKDSTQNNGLFANLAAIVVGTGGAAALYQLFKGGEAPKVKTGEASSESAQSDKSNNNNADGNQPVEPRESSSVPAVILPPDGGGSGIVLLRPADVVSSSVVSDGNNIEDNNVEVVVPGQVGLLNTVGNFLRVISFTTTKKQNNSHPELQQAS